MHLESETSSLQKVEPTVRTTGAACRAMVTESSPVVTLPCHSCRSRFQGLRSTPVIRATPANLAPLVAWNCPCPGLQQPSRVGTAHKRFAGARSLRQRGTITGRAAGAGCQLAGSPCVVAIQPAEEVC